MRSRSECGPTRPTPVYPPPPPTGPGGLNRFERARRVAALRTRTHWLANAARLPKGLPHVEVTLHYAVPRRRGDSLAARWRTPVEYSGA